MSCMCRTTSRTKCVAIAPRLAHGVASTKTRNRVFAQGLFELRTGKLDIEPLHRVHRFARRRLLV
jgi:hypothetical protein